MAATAPADQQIEAILTGNASNDGTTVVTSAGTEFIAEIVNLSTVNQIGEVVNASHSNNRIIEGATGIMINIIPLWRTRHD